MDSVTQFLSVNFGDGSGSGDGSGDGSGSGSGSGSGDGSGDGSGSGSGFGFGDGSGDGDGSGSGFGCGSGDGFGCAYGFGGIKTFNRNHVYLIDEVPTIVTHVKGNVAHGAILNRDLTTSPCYIAKQNNLFAHGKSLKEAMDALREKLMGGMPEGERIAAFVKEHDLDTEYPCTDFFRWHHILTGSCDMGRRQFALNHQIDIERDSLTTRRFIELTESAYGGDVIRRLKVEYMPEMPE